MNRNTGGSTMTEIDNMRTYNWRWKYVKEEWNENINDIRRGRGDRQIGAFDERKRSTGWI